MIRPDLGAFTPFDLVRASEIIRAGYLETMGIIPKLKAALLALGSNATEDTT
jgi:hypothetical protein